MTELKFKLKKDGKAVGSLYIKDGCISLCPREFDTAHPFVCKDRNGKDVYEGDKVKVWSGETCEHSVTVHWDGSQKAFLFDEFKRGWPSFYSQYDDIELIEEGK